MEENKYILTEGQLRQLIERDLTLRALEAGGVDNWSWYGDSLIDYFKEYVSDEDHDIYEGIENLVERELETYFRIDCTN